MTYKVFWLNEEGLQIGGEHQFFSQAKEEIVNNLLDWVGVELNEYFDKYFELEEIDTFLGKGNNNQYNVIFNEDKFFASNPNQGLLDEFDENNWEGIFDMNCGFGLDKTFFIVEEKEF